MAASLVGLLIVVVVMGAMTTSTGSGLAFTDWPLSDGELIPERSYKTLAGFLEHFHRVPAGIAVLIALALAFALRRYPVPARPWAVAGAVLIVVQAVIGGVGVLKGLPLLSSTLHGLLAQITVAACAITAYLLSGRYARTVPTEDPMARVVRKWTVIALVMIIFQTLLGAITRHTTNGSEHALWSHVANAFLVFLVIIVTLGTASRLAPIPGVKGLCGWCMGALMFQVVLGFVALLVRRGKDPENIEYLWRASLISSHVLLGILLTVLLSLLAIHVRHGTLLPGTEKERV